MKITRIIGIAGKARTGKDTVAIHLEQSHGFDRRAFAEPIREVAKYLLMMTEDELEVNKEGKLGWVDTSYREFAQKLGTEFAREMIDQDFWLKRMREFIIQSEPSLLVISDVRFENEAQWIRKMGGEIWHLIKPDASLVREHVSEKGIEVLWGEPQIINDSTLPILYRKIDRLIEREK